MSARFAGLCLLAVVWTLAFLHAVLYAISPVGSAQPSNVPFAAWLLYLLIVTVIVIAGLQTDTKAVARSCPDTPGRILLSSANLLPLLALVSIVGLCAHVFAKLSLLPPGAGYCSLRDVFLSSHDRPVSPLLRATSMAGHLLTSAGYAGLVIATYGSLIAEKTRRHCRLYFAFFFIALLIYALAMVSRSVVMTLLGVVMSAAVFAFLDKSLLIRKALVRLLYLGAIATSFAMVFAVGVGISPILCRNESQLAAGPRLQDYRNDLPVGFKRPGRSESANMLDNDLMNKALAPVHDFMRVKCAVCGQLAIYVSHGIFNFEHVANVAERGDRVLLAFVPHWLHRLGFVSAPDKENLRRVYGRGGISLVGAAYHDYAWTGVTAVAFAFGAATLAVVFLLSSGSLSAAVGIVGYLALMITALFGFMFVGPSTLAFPFVMLSCFLVFGSQAWKSTRTRHISRASK